MRQDASDKSKNPWGASYSLNDVVKAVSATEKGAKKFEIDPNKTPVTRDDLRSLLPMNLEVSLHEKSGNLVFGAGEKQHPQSDEELGIERGSKLYLHTHHDGLENTFISFADVFAAQRYGPETQLIQLSRDGFVVYKRPQFDPIRQQPTDESARELMHEWGKREGIDFFGGGMEGRRDFTKLPMAEKMQIARQFCGETQMIVTEASLDDDEEVERILSAINLQTRISDNVVPRMPSMLDGSNMPVDTHKLNHAQRANLEAAVGHFDQLLIREGRLFYELPLRKAWKDFGLHLIEEIRKEGVDPNIEMFLDALKSKASLIDIE